MLRQSNNKTTWTLTLASVLLPAGVAKGQLAPPPPHHEELHAVDFGTHHGDPAGPYLAQAEEIHFPDAPWMRLHFADAQLGNASYLRFTAMQDGSEQTLDACGLGHWQYSTAFFRGDRVLVELFVAPQDRNVSAVLQSATVGEKPPGGEPSGDRSLCGADNRVASSDDRVGRYLLGGCTVWLVSNGAVLTAGHCATPSVIEFDPPASSANGTTNPSNPNDQFPVVAGSAVSANGGVGNDWHLFAIGPNGLGERAHEKYGFFRMTRTTPNIGSLLRITGCGLDNTPAGSGGGPCCDVDADTVCDFNCNAQNMTNQTQAGPYEGELTSPPTNIWHTYDVDTTPGNSGSPIIWYGTDWTIGIHTHGGCETSGIMANRGTSFEHNPLESALQDFCGPNAEHVDTESMEVAVSGYIFQPWSSVTEAVNTVTDGGTICIVAGDYSAAAGNTFTAGADGRAMTLVSPVGTVTIGN